jgi:hypothetical protein
VALEPVQAPRQAVSEQACRGRRQARKGHREEGSVAVRLQFVAQDRRCIVAKEILTMNKGAREQVIEPTCSSPGFAWLANVFRVGLAPQSRDDSLGACDDIKLSFI